MRLSTVWVIVGGLMFALEAITTSSSGPTLWLVVDQQFMIAGAILQAIEDKK